MNANNTTDALPKEMYVVTRARVRAGKPPMKIEPLGHASCSGNPIWVKAAPTRAHASQRLFLRKNCYATLDEALNAVDEIAKTELTHEWARMNRLKSNLDKARNTARASAA